MDNTSCKMYSYIHRKDIVQDDLLKRVSEVMFSTQKSWLHYCQLLYSVFAPHIRDIMGIIGGSIIDYYIDHYKSTDLDFEINNADVYHDTLQFLLKNNYDYSKKECLFLADRDSYTETPIGDLSLVCGYVNGVICSHSGEIIHTAKNFLYSLLETDDKFPMYSRRKPHYVQYIN